VRASVTSTNGTSFSEAADGTGFAEDETSGVRISDLVEKRLS
jgi:hypothetical protein